MCAMQIPNDNESLLEDEQPQETEIHGLEDTQANLIPEMPETSTVDTQATTVRIHRDDEGRPASDSALIEADHSPSLTAEPAETPAQDEALALDEAPQDVHTAQTVRLAARPADLAEQATETSETAPPTPPPTSSEKAGKRRPRWVLISVLGLLALGTIALMAGLTGYFSGISMRQNAAITQVAQAARDQFELAVEDYAQGNYFRARQRLEYVIQIDPSYPGAVDLLADVLMELNTTATPTLIPTATPVPTADLRGVEELYNQGAQYMMNGEWTQAIDAFLSLRKSNPDYRKVEIDGQIFLALRHRGRDKILLEQDLEGGIYDLTLAGRFGIMDVEGQSLLTWSTAYITGASFWEIDWSQAAYYFSQVAPYAPNLMDKSGMTARERYRQALVRYASILLNQKQFCKAQEQLAIALSILQDPEIQAAHDQAAQLCSGVPAPGEQPTQEP